MAGFFTTRRKRKRKHTLGVSETGAAVVGSGAGAGSEAGVGAGVDAEGFFRGYVMVGGFCDWVAVPCSDCIPGSA